MVLIIADFAGGGTLLLLLTSTDQAKDLLISKGLFIGTKKRTKIFLYFCPSL
jgi:hypothetical protein